MSQVIFFPLKFIPSEEKLEELRKQQENLHYSRVSFINAIKRETPFQQVLAHARYKNLIREKIKVIQEDVCE